MIPRIILAIAAHRQRVADARRNDSTITELMRRAVADDASELTVGNMYALRDSDGVWRPVPQEDAAV